MTTSVAKNIIIKQPNYLINNIINEVMRLNAYGIPSATEVVLFLELGKNKVSSQRSSIPLGDALSLSKRMHRSVENIQSSHLHSVRNASFVRLCEKTFVRLRGRIFITTKEHKGFTKEHKD
ncbi:MAG: hypothetical protein FWH18_10015 [Marinilabiliaceae bacterium]|nr:hypothetical protein [Marinilabiliaceae bacterium]